MTAFLTSFFFIFLAETGDKTQFLAMAFAARYKALTVLIAVFLATIINHSLAVLVGFMLTKIIPIDIISFLAAISFLLFALWTIRGDDPNPEVQAKQRFGALLTVGIAFFLAEMGDKTQLTTISLAVEYRNVFQVLMGTTLGMLAADALGIIVGVLMNKHIPENIVKTISATIFAVFGFAGIYNSLAGHFNLALILLILMFSLGLFLGVVYWLTRKSPEL